MLLNMHGAKALKILTLAATAEQSKALSGSQTNSSGCPAVRYPTPNTGRTLSSQ